MKIFTDLSAWRTHRLTLLPGLSIGFVPTMGNLHQGHASLYQLSKQHNDLTVASLFINPKQFNQTTDYLSYPRTLDADLAYLTDLNVDYCLLPSENDIYPDGYHFQVQETALSLIMEGLYRPGHFNGVLTVVLKLLQLVKAHRAYFGEKDFQQYQLIKNMTNAFFIDTDIIAGPTIREFSGLACSSRNNRLNLSQRQQADKFAQIFHQPSKNIQAIITALKTANIDVAYVEEHHNRRFAAVNIDDIRLIDNYANDR